MSRGKHLKFVCKVFRQERGITLMELLLATVIGLVVLLAFGGIDMTRIFLTHDANSNALFQTNVAYAMTHISRELMDVDRVVLISPSNMQLRRVIGTDLDDVDSYDWTQYRYDEDDDEIILYRQTENGGNCAPPNQYVVAENITAVIFAYSDESVVPPGAEPSVGNDSNMLMVTITSEDPTTQIQFTMRSIIAIRQGAYTDVDTGLSNALPPPTVCT